MTSRTVEFKSIENMSVFDWYIARGATRETFSARELKRLFYESRDTEEYESVNEKLRSIAREYKVPFLDRIALACDDSKRECAWITRDGYKAL